MHDQNRTLTGLWRWARALAGNPGSPSISHAMSAEEREFLRRMFVPHFYARAAGLRDGMPVESLFSHFLTKGMAQGISPTPLFEPALFLEQEGTPDPAHSDAPDILRWLRTRTETSIIPTRRFDPEFYLHTYEELVTAEVDPFEHFIRHGLAEHRRPNGLFDPDFYKLTARILPGEEDLPPYLHFLTCGVERGEAPAAVLAPILVRTPAERMGSLAGYDAAIAAIEPWVHSIGAEQVAILLSVFHPYLYDGEGQLAPSSSGLTRLTHFLQVGLDAGHDPGPMFDSALYRERAGLDPIQLGQNGRSLLHFLNDGFEAPIVPTDLFDAEAYRTAWRDMRDPQVSGFRHFLLAGIFEGRRIDGEERVGVWTLPLDSCEGQLHNWQLFWDEAGYPAPAIEESAPRMDAEQIAPPQAIDSSGISPADLALVKAMFVPAWYARQAGLDEASAQQDLLSHYLSVGMPQNISPGPLFDPEMAIRQCGASSNESAMRLWLTRHRHNWPAPTAYFDRDHYRRGYKEFHGSTIDLFEHYLLHGQIENRAPNALFDPNWYNQAYQCPIGEEGLSAYQHYLTLGADRGLAPSRLLQPTFAFSGTKGHPKLADFSRLLDEVRNVSRDLTPEQVQTLFAFFMPHAHDADQGDQPADNGVDRLIEFLSSGLQQGVSPGPFFDPSVYADTTVSRKKLFSRNTPPFIHYLRHGWSKRVIPNDIFDEQAYHATQPDIRTQQIWGFRHFINHGLFEGRRFGNAPRLALAPRGDDFASSELRNWQLFWSAYGPVAAKFNLPGAIVAQQKRLADVLSSKLFDDIVRRAQAIDPALGEPRTLTEVYAAPHHDTLADVMRSLRHRIGNKRYDTIVTVPWLRTGGADLVACQLAEAVTHARPDERVLLLRVDRDNLERPDWVPQGVDQVLISDLLDSVSPDYAETLLYALFLGLKPRRIINVNSFKVWRTFERFGKRLTTELSLYSYLFCWDQTPEGLRVGYPSMFYASTSPHLAGTFTDTDFLRDELVRLYRPPASIQARTIPVYTPSRTAPTKVVCAQLAAEKRAARRPLVLWAGRLDRQKRFDLVQQIARAMPHVDFHCWGDALLDSPPDHRKSPGNLVLNPGFKDYAELPFEDADLWLFTSAWEGMPTILIEIAVRGMSVVASQVGGVPELVNDETGFAVHEVDDVSAYVSAVQFAIDNPDERIERARKLQARAMERYTQASYLAQLKGIFDSED